MASIYTNLRTERQYRASTGLSEQTFNQLFEQFKRFYVPKKGNLASPYEPLFQDAREALFFILFYYIITKLIRPYRYSACSLGVQINQPLSI
jgi:hypothetical protein